MISWEHLLEFVLQIVARPRLKDDQQLQRFNSVRERYSEICDILLSGSEGVRLGAEGYDWSGWAGQVRQSFRDGVPLGFLRQSTLGKTMVFARRRGIRATRQRVQLVSDVFGPKTAATMVEEDYIGLPTITSVQYMT